MVRSCSCTTCTQPPRAHTQQRTRTNTHTHTRTHAHTHTHTSAPGLGFLVCINWVQNFLRNFSNWVHCLLRTLETWLLTFESLFVILCCLFFQRKKNELSNLQALSPLTLWPTSMLFFHQSHLDLALSSAVFFFLRYLRPLCKRHVASHTLCERVTGASVPRTRSARHAQFIAPSFFLFPVKVILSLYWDSIKTL